MTCLNRSIVWVVQIVAKPSLGGNPIFISVSKNLKEFKLDVEEQKIYQSSGPYTVVAKITPPIIDGVNENDVAIDFNDKLGRFQLNNNKVMLI